MTSDDFIYFSDCRSFQFAYDSREKFIEFLNLTEKGFEFIERNKALLDFLSYLATRCIGNIIENIIRNRNNGKLEIITERITAEDAKEEIRKSLDHIKFNLRKTIKDSAVSFLIIPYFLEHRRNRLQTLYEREHDRVPY